MERVKANDERRFGRRKWGTKDKLIFDNTVQNVILLETCHDRVK